MHVDLLELPAHRLMNVIHTWFIRRIRITGTQEDLEMFETMLNEPFDWEKQQIAQGKNVAGDLSGDDEIAMMRAAMGA